MIDDRDIVKRILEISSLHLPQLESNQAIDDYIKIIQEKLKIERIKQLEQELSQTYDPRQQAKILQEIIDQKIRSKLWQRKKYKQFHLMI